MKRIIAIVGCWLLLLSATLCCAQTYTVTDLGVPASTATLVFAGTSEGYAINKSGMVTGYATLSPPGWRGFIYSGGQTTDLQQDYVDPSGYGYWSNVYPNNGLGINDAGQVVGTAWYFYPFTYDGTFHVWGLKCTNGINNMVPVTVLDAHEAVAVDINNVGQVVGWSDFYGGATCNVDKGQHASIWDTKTGKLTDLGTLRSTLPTPQSAAEAINDNGQVTGYSSVGSGGEHAFLYSHGKMIDIDLSPSSADYISLGHAINSLGHVAGSFQSNSSCCLMHSFFYDGRTTRDLDKADLYGYTVAWGINSSDQIVGMFHEPNGPARAILYKPSSGPGFTDLNTLIPSDSGWILQDARAINDKGQITGVGEINGSSHAFLLTPVNPYAAFVQQPINPDGSSVFSAKKGVVSIRFSLTEANAATCALPPATISITRTAGGTLGTVVEGDFGIDSSKCRYYYNLNPSTVGAGTYRVDISINGLVSGSAQFALK